MVTTLIDPPIANWIITKILIYRYSQSYFIYNSNHSIIILKISMHTIFNVNREFHFFSNILSIVATQIISKFLSTRSINFSSRKKIHEYLCLAIITNEQHEVHHWAGQVGCISRFHLISNLQSTRISLNLSWRRSAKRLLALFRKHGRGGRKNKGKEGTSRKVEGKRDLVLSGERIRGWRGRVLSIKRIIRLGWII